MKWFIKNVPGMLLVVAVLAVGLLSGAAAVRADEKGAGYAQQIQGSWILVSIVNEQDGKKTDVLGPNPRGLMILAPDGSYSHIIMRESLPKFVANSRTKGTAEENQAVLQGSNVVFGTYSVLSDKDQAVNLHIVGSTFPNWDGQDQKRIMTVKGDELIVVNPTPAIGSGTNTVVYKRAK